MKRILSKSGGQILQVAATLQVLFSMDTSISIPAVIRTLIELCPSQHGIDIGCNRINDDIEKGMYMLDLSNA